jgi:hypothetical protein
LWEEQLKVRSVYCSLKDFMLLGKKTYLAESLTRTTCQPIEILVRELDDVLDHLDGKTR